MMPGSAGYDLRSPRDYVLPPKERIFIPTDLMTQIQPGFHGIILSRSGPALNSHVHVTVGLVDGDYRGNIGILLYNLHQHMPFYVARGMRQFTPTYAILCGTGYENCRDNFPTDDESYLCKGNHTLFGSKCFVQG